VLGHQARPVTVSELDAARPIVPERCRHPARCEPDLDLGRERLEGRKSRYQPLGRKGWSNPNREHPGARAGRDLRRQVSDGVKQGREPGLVSAPGCRQGEPVSRPLEQGDPQPLLKQVHQPADRSRRDVQLRSRAGETTVASRRLKRLEAVEGGQSSNGGHRYKT
jgi:hypothetical protein